ncbi:MAG: hypothetical protein ACOCQ9_00450 [Candidatus Brocadiia bacterium]
MPTAPEQTLSREDAGGVFSSTHNNEPGDSAGDAGVRSCRGG